MLPLWRITISRKWRPSARVAINRGTSSILFTVGLLDIVLYRVFQFWTHLQKMWRWRNISLHKNNIDNDNNIKRCFVLFVKLKIFIDAVIDEGEVLWEQFPYRQFSMNGEFYINVNMCLQHITEQWVIEWGFQRRNDFAHTSNDVMRSAIAKLSRLVFAKSSKNHQFLFMLSITIAKSAKHAKHGCPFAISKCYDITPVWHLNNEDFRCRSTGTSLDIGQTTNRWWSNICRLRLFTRSFGEWLEHRHSSHHTIMCLLEMFARKILIAYVSSK